MADDLRVGTELVNAQGAVLVTSVDDGDNILITWENPFAGSGSARLLTSNIEASNGVIHIIDQVLRLSPVMSSRNVCQPTVNCLVGRESR